eukprot:TRINITY_DN38403_c0_g1_i1.p1 TRINITY_DN38403_c0_g1~~TRINITY_DN38403_c0_g1_i1.p1  ORF type:complete len:544 (-),score=81.64 TRINITY_DN38403_c0_g1_i1:14-1645(-)
MAAPPTRSISRLWRPIVVNERTERRLSTRTRECLSLEDPELLRATPAAEILRARGSLLKDSKGSAETFEKSMQVEQIDTFISHNWSTPAMQKWMVLSIHFNFTLAVSVSCLCMTASFILTVAGFFPCIKFGHGGMVMGRTGALTLFIGSASLILTLFFGRGVAAILGLTGPRAFLDKTCIHQTDPELKMKGIRSLAAQLNRSSSVVVVYTETYLQKVWTVYELASALILNPNMVLVVLPVFMSKLVLLGALFYPIRYSAVLLLKTDATGAWGNKLARYGFDLVLFPVYLLFGILLRGWAKERLLIKKTVDQFDIRSATCAFEADRALVQANVVSFMRDFAYVNKDSSSEEAIWAFNSLVRQKVPTALVAAFGCTGISPLFLCSAFICSVGRCLDAVSAQIVSQEQGSAMLFEIYVIMTLYFSAIPNTLAFMSWVLSQKPETPYWWCDTLLVVLSALGTVLLNLIFKHVLLVLKSAHFGNSDGLLSVHSGVMLLLGCASFTTTYYLFRPNGCTAGCWCRCCMPRQIEEASYGSDDGSEDSDSSD